MSKSEKIIGTTLYPHVTVLEVLAAKLAKYEGLEAKRVAWCHRHRVNPDTGDYCGNWKNAIAACKEAIAEERG